MENKVLVEISARHVHLSKEDLETLFGKGYELTVKKELSQPGQFASNERVRVIGSKSEFPAVSILGPCRKETLEGTGSCKLVGPAGEIEITKGVIAAKRHIHATTADAEKMGLTNGEIVSVAIPTSNGRNLTFGEIVSVAIPTSNGRNLTFGDVVVRVSDSYALAMHIDTDVWRQTQSVLLLNNCIFSTSGR